MDGRPPLPDHRPKVWRKSRNYFANAEIAELSSAFEFHDEYSLDARLEGCLERYRSHSSAPTGPAKREKRELITAVRDSTALLSEALTKIGPAELRLAQPPTDTYGRAKTARNLALWNEWAIVALQALEGEPVKGGAIGLPAEKSLICNLVDVYEAGTGRQSTYTQKPQNVFVGEVVRFIERTLEVAGNKGGEFSSLTEVSNSFIGATVKAYRKGRSSRNE